MAARLANSPSTATTLAKQKLLGDTLTWEGKKLLYIAHSQGNLWVNLAYKNAVAQRGYDSSNVHVVHIAPASPTLSPNSDYILSDNDWVIDGVLNWTSGEGAVLEPNVSIPYTGAETLGHGLSEIYLSDPDSLKMIRSAVSRGFKRLKKPEIEDFLFEINFSYGGKVPKLYALSEFGFVDWVEDGYEFFTINMMGHSGYAVEDGVWWKHKLRPYRTSISGLTWDVKRDGNERITINHCNEPGVEQPIMGGKYMFATLSNLNELVEVDDSDKEFIGYINTSLIDRYGESWIKHTQNISANRWPECTSAGAEIELGLGQEHYTEEQKEMLSELNLSGRYDVYANYFNDICFRH